MILVDRLVELRDLEHRRLRVDVHVEPFGTPVAGAVDRLDQYAGCAVRQLGAHRERAPAVGLGVRLDSPAADGDGGERLGGAGEGRGVGVDAPGRQLLLELERGDLGVDHEVPVFAQVAAEQVGAAGAEADRVLPVVEGGGRERQRVPLAPRSGRDVPSVEGDGHVLEPGESLDVQGQRGRRVLDVGAGAGVVAETRGTP